MSHSDRELGITPKWFTGKEWADGTAVRENRKEQAAAEAKAAPKERTVGKKDTEPDWTGTCEVCGASPIVPATGMCGPCTFGEADTVGGNW